MRHRHHRGGERPPLIDPAFAQALAGPEFDRHPRPKQEHKARQLCRQAQHALNLALEGEILRDLYIADVTPAPDASHLLVHVAVPPQISAIDALTALNDAATYLRTAVARAITRKRAPGLTFIIAPREEAQP